MRNHMEEKFNLVEQILVWGGSKYTREKLNSLNLPKLRQLYTALEFEQLSKL